MDNYRHIVNKANTAFSTTERSNFESLWNSALGMCRPTSCNVNGGSTEGEKKRVDRYIDVGVNSLDRFTAGLISTLIPKGSRYFEFVPSKKRASADESLKRWLVDCSRITLDILNESNFYIEMTKAISDLGVIGTSLVVTEPSVEDGVRFKTFYISNFAVEEDANGRIDTVYFKLNLNARQVMQMFGEKALTDKMKSAMNNNIDIKFGIVHAILPRDAYSRNSLNPRKQKFASLFIDEETGSLLKESGFSVLPASVCRWTQASNEIYGRSPAMQAQGNLAMANQMELTKLKSAQRIASPQWLLPNDGSVRNLNNQAGGIVFYNAANPNGIPQQIVPKDMPNITDAYQQQKMLEIQQAFFIDVFNPMQDVTGNTTATEINARMSIARQNLVPKINRVIDELIEPILKRTFRILFDGGYFPEAPENVNIGDVALNMMSTSGLILKQAEAVGALQTIESMTIMAQVKPQILDYINEDELMKLVAYSNAVPTNIIRSDFEVKKIREARAAMQQQQMQQQQLLDAAKIYQGTSKAAESGSPAELLSQFS